MQLRNEAPRCRDARENHSSSLARARKQNNQTEISSRYLATLQNANANIRAVAYLGSRYFSASGRTSERLQRRSINSPLNKSNFAQVSCTLLTRVTRHVAVSYRDRLEMQWRYDGTLNSQVSIVHIIVALTNLIRVLTNEKRVAMISSAREVNLSSRLRSNIAVEIE